MNPVAEAKLTESFRPQHQRHIHGFDREGINGDCLRTCLAVLFGLRLDEVPHFGRIKEDDPDGLWWWSLVGWCYSSGWHIEAVDEAEHAGWYLMDGYSPHGLRHVVVAHDGVVLWDPNPAGGGLTRAVGAFLLAPLPSTLDRWAAA